MAVAVIETFADLRDFLNSVIQADQNDIGDAPHGAFWNTVSYDQFVNGTVPGVVGNVPILVKGQSAASNLILALQGVGPLFNNQDGKFGQMPADGPPFFTADQIQSVANWIDRGCPNVAVG